MLMIFPSSAATLQDAIMKTLDHIRKLSGSHFDPQVADMFVKMTTVDQQDL
jgi:hypothetical protein